MIPHISLSEESFAAQLEKRELNMKTRYRLTMSSAQLQKRELNMKTRYRRIMSKRENNFYKAERLKWSDQGEMGLREKFCRFKPTLLYQYAGHAHTFLQ